MDSKKTLTVDLGDRSYPIFIGSKLLSDKELLPLFCTDQVLVVTNQTVEPLYAEKIQSVLQGRVKKVHLVSLPDGEKYKNFETLNLIFDALLQNTFNRKSTVVALGGGVVGDMAGFAAACYQRGVNFIQVPTTLLSQVDSSVGGKTGINHPLGKNMVGAFYQPQCVLIDMDVLDTLPQRELSAGLAEVIKYGLIYDNEFFCWLESNIEALMSFNKDALAYAIEKSCEIKADVVAQDEHEGGIRAILNLGHTFGHAIESAMGYGNWLHGEAVGCGMIMAADMSKRLGWLSAKDVERTKSLIRAAGLPDCVPEEMGADVFLKYMAVDKKNINDRIRLVLLNEIGRSCICDDYDREILQETLESFCSAR